MARPSEIIKVYSLRSILSINFPNQIKMHALTTVADEYNKPNWVFERFKISRI